MDLLDTSHLRSYLELVSLLGLAYALWRLLSEG